MFTISPQEYSCLLGQQAQRPRCACSHGVNGERQVCRFEATMPAHLQSTTIGESHFPVWQTRQIFDALLRNTHLRTKRMEAISFKPGDAVKGIYPKNAV
jgi:hypothetical protein